MSAHASPGATRRDYALYTHSAVFAINQLGAKGLGEIGLVGVAATELLSPLVPIVRSHSRRG